MDILQITKPTEYFRRLAMIREGKHDVKKAMAGVPDPFEIHHMHLNQIPSYRLAESKAMKGEVYCWYCASIHVVKNGHKEKNSIKYSFKCHDCKSSFSYGLSSDTYKSFNGFKFMQKRKYKPRKK